MRISAKSKLRTRVGSTSIHACVNKMWGRRSPPAGLNCFGKLRACPTSFRTGNYAKSRATLFGSRGNLPLSTNGDLQIAVGGLEPAAPWQRRLDGVSPYHKKLIACAAIFRQPS